MSEKLIVVIDDERDVLQAVCDLLDMEGRPSVCFQNPDAALSEMLADGEPALFLMDIMMPQCSGIQLAQRLQDAGFHDTPMVAMSASTTMLRAAAQTNLFEETLAKPFELTDLLETVQRFAA